MIRRIVSTQLQAAGAVREIDTYFDRVVKYIPTEIVGAWIAIKGLVESATVSNKQTILWICLPVGVILAALWTLKQTSMLGKPPAVTQTIISTFAFIVWVVALGEPFVTLLGKSEQALYGSILLIFFTLIVGLIVPRES